MPDQTPHLLQLLFEEYQAQLLEAKDEDSNLKLAAISPFLRFAHDYLNENRPVGLRYDAESNYILQLRNNKFALVSPPIHDVYRRSRSIPLGVPRSNQTGIESTGWIDLADPKPIEAADLPPPIPPTTYEQYRGRE